MKFNSVATSLKPEVARVCAGRFRGLTLELGVRKDNEHVGSGRGGNNYQLMVLMGLKHHLIQSHDTQIRLQADRICWGSEYLLTARRTKLRDDLDSIFPAIEEKNKVLALAMQSLLDNPTGLVRTANAYSHNYPTVMQLIETKTYTHNPKLSMHEQFILASLITAKIAGDLDRGDESLVDVVGEALGHFDHDIILLTVRCNIQIDRLVRYNLDERPTWMKWLCQINKEVDT